MKLPLYARAGATEYWIVNLKRGIADRYSEPDGTGYANTDEHPRGEKLALPLAPDIVVTLDLMFG